ncbi:MAG: hypothetical protein ACLQIB_41935 [Isosphaeraceae bacterium]
MRILVGSRPLGCPFSGNFAAQSLAAALFRNSMRQGQDVVDGDLAGFRNLDQKSDVGGTGLAVHVRVTSRLSGARQNLLRW